MRRDRRRLTATQRATRARATSRYAMTRDLMTGVVLARLWSAYLMPPHYPNEEFPLMLCVNSPAGLLTWRMTGDESDYVKQWLQLELRRNTTHQDPVDRLPILQALAENGWSQ